MPAISTTTLQLPNELVTPIISKISDESVIAKLSPSVPQVFLNSQYTVFTQDPEAEFVAEGAQKSAGIGSMTPVVAETHKAVTTVRMNDEVQIADQDAMLGIISTITDKMALAGARALDYGIIHGVSPLQGTAVTGMTPLRTAANQQTATADADADVDALPDAIITAGYVPNGIALSTTFANTLRKVRDGNGYHMFHEISLNPADTSTVGGLAAAVSGTVQGRRVAGANSTWGTNLLALAGDFSMVKWGIVRNIGVEVIRYGDPDGLGDLRRNNQIALRTEIYYSWAVIDPLAFTALHS